MLEQVQTQLEGVTSLFGSFSIDALVLAAVIVALVIYTVRFGKESITALILALYIALLAFIHFPYKEQFLIFSDTEVQHLISNALIFAVFAVIGYVTVTPLLHNPYAMQRKQSWFDAVFLSLATVALLITFSYHVLPIAGVHTFGTPIAELFSPSQFFFWWLIAPLAVLLLTGRR